MCPKPATFMHKVQLCFSFDFKHSEQELVCKMEPRLLVMSYGCFSDKIWNKWLFQPDFISEVEHCGTKARKFLHIATI